MEKNSSHNDLRYRALAEAASAAVAGQGVEVVAGKGLEAACRFVGLAAGALLVWDEKRKITARAIVAPNDSDKKILIETEDNLLRSLRDNFKLRSAYMELGEDPVKSLFNLPLEISGVQFGALLGIKIEKANLFEFDEFLKSLAAVLALAVRPSGVGEKVDQEEIKSKIKSERDEAIIELAVAVNHEINNPLTALIGNLQLLMMKHKDLPDEFMTRLKTVEESANQIREVTARLMKAAEAPSVVYTGDMKMIDLSGKSEQSDDTSENDKSN